jgi:hypothetical protein
VNFLISRRIATGDARMSRRTRRALARGARK